VSGWNVSVGLPEETMTYAEWEAEVPRAIRDDTLWKIEAYRLGLFLSDLAWHDTGNLLKDRRMFSVADQLFRAVGNISSNVGEGYSKSSGKDRARFYEYALGSAREARDWYFKARHAADPLVIEHRIELTTQIIRLTLTMAANERRRGKLVLSVDES
jgi:four helix bundle protein